MKTYIFIEKCTLPGFSPSDEDIIEACQMHLLHREIIIQSQFIMVVINCSCFNPVSVHDPLS